MTFPASMPGVVAVGSTDSEERITTFSSTGEKVIYAPGQDVTVLRNVGKPETHSGGAFSATVAGAILADLWSQSPTLTATQLMDGVRRTAKQISDDKGGLAPLIDGYTALEWVRSGGQNRAIQIAPQKSPYK